MVAKIKKGTEQYFYVWWLILFSFPWDKIVSFTGSNYFSACSEQLNTIDMLCTPHNDLTRRKWFCLFCVQSVKASSQCTYTARKCYVFWIRIYIWKIGIVAEIRILVNNAVYNIPDLKSARYFQTVAWNKI